jgi:uncharacterized protein (DUF4415 family)
MTTKKRASKPVSRKGVRSVPSAELKRRIDAITAEIARGLKKAKARHVQWDPDKVSDRVMKALRIGADSTWVDPDDAPEWTQEQFERADLYHGDKLIRRGRPPSANPKKALKLRIDADVVEHFRATGPGWQTRINDTLRRAAKLRQPA